MNTGCTRKTWAGERNLVQANSMYTCKLTSLTTPSLRPPSYTNPRSWCWTNQVILSGSLSVAFGKKLYGWFVPLGGELEGVSEVKRQGRGWLLRLFPGTEPKDVLQLLLARGHDINEFRAVMPSLEDIFVQVVGEGHE
ncbi:MAG: hypothetical protein XD60_0742 [Acetothermia bacterium 64_32]|nr:MAG: hypothetical protein XD60_0742 [Acetothermia bacterium 64_32]